MMCKINSCFSVILVYFVLVLSTSLFAQYKSVRIQVIDRGQADGILIRTPNQQWIVIDAGTNSQQSEAMSNVWGVDTVDWVYWKAEP